MKLDADFWNDRYLQGETGWDLGAVSPPLKAYFDGLTNKELRILIPGCGNAYEAEYLHRGGFTQVTVIDLAPEAIARFKQRVPDFPAAHVILGNLFEHQGQYDLIVEQTFFCAIHPALRPTYAQHLPTLLAPKGRLVGLLFNIPLNVDRPPFGGNEAEYRALFKGHFTIERMEPCLHSVKPRLGNELWVEMSPGAV